MGFASTSLKVNDFKKFLHKIIFFLIILMREYIVVQVGPTLRD